MTSTWPLPGSSSKNLSAAISFPEAQLNLLTLYDEHLPVLHPIDAIEFKTTFRAREEAWAQLEFLDVSFTSRMIAEEQGPDAAPGVLTQAVGEERRFPVHTRD